MQQSLKSIHTTLEYNEPHQLQQEPDSLQNKGSERYSAMEEISQIPGTLELFTLNEEI